MKIYFIIIGGILISFFIGIYLGTCIGIKHMKNIYLAQDGQWIEVDPEEIQHVGYTAEQCGYDK